MALVTCPDCTSRVSDAAPACPNCGRALRTPRRGAFGVIAFCMRSR